MAEDAVRQRRCQVCRSICFFNYNNVHFLIFTHSLALIHIYRNERKIWHGIDKYDSNKLEDKNNGDNEANDRGEGEEQEGEDKETVEEQEDEDEDKKKVVGVHCRPSSMALRRRRPLPNALN